MSPGARRALVYAVVIAVMVALHHDVWLFRDRRLLGGVLPVGLAWHIGYSILSSVVMFALVRFDWPRELEEDRAPQGEAPEDAGAPGEAR